MLRPFSSKSCGNDAARAAIDASRSFSRTARIVRYVVTPPARRIAQTVRRMVTAIRRVMVALPSLLLPHPLTRTLQLSRLGREDVTEPAPCVDQLGLVSFVDLVAQVSDVHVHHVAGDLVMLVVEVLPDLCTGDDLVLAVGQVFQQGELPRGELNRLSAST